QANEAIDALDALIDEARSGTPVLWFGRDRPKPFASNIRPLNQVLAWRLVERGHVTYKEGAILRVEMARQVGEGQRWRYSVVVSIGGKPENFFAHEVIARHGPKKVTPLEEPDLANIGKAMAERHADDVRTIAPEVFEHFRAQYRHLLIVEQREHL